MVAHRYTMGVEKLPLTPAQIADFEFAELLKWPGVVQNVKPE